MSDEYTKAVKVLDSAAALRRPHADGEQLTLFALDEALLLCPPERTREYVDDLIRMGRKNDLPLTDEQ